VACVEQVEPGSVVLSQIAVERGSPTEELLMRIFNSLAVAAVAVAATALIPQTASAERVCRENCVGPVCQERCIETEGRGGDRRREGREERRGERFEGRQERRPGVEIRAPGVEVEVGR
jgi:hypothetical protein